MVSEQVFLEFARDNLRSRDLPEADSMGLKLAYSARFTRNE